ncbi:hypothetical protein Dsin_022006 [Dipteronia sinensis]|uniref:Uncharacterized protein n=1 Tax=Dipteronia sinensis TaxID=43782 RepID=A0AAE0A266_9ROSI|nr:hypothetical protein Dsin_022006 [Dipteronia sinensis]
MRGLGFSDLNVFNRVLLAKQSWRLVMNPGSLAGCVLKHCYFLTGSFLEAGCSGGVLFFGRAGGGGVLVDSLCWHYTKNEEYSVMSGYKVALEEEATTVTWAKEFFYEFQVVKVGGNGQQLATKQDVVRYYEGQVMGTNAQSLDVGYSSEITEAVAILYGIFFC